MIGTVKSTVLRMMPEINFGSLLDKKNKRKVYFSAATEFLNVSYSKLHKGDIVEILVVRTPRGLFAKTLFLKKACPVQETQVDPGL